MVAPEETQERREVRGQAMTPEQLVRCHECGCIQREPHDPFCAACDEDLRPLVYVDPEIEDDTRD